jgi:hypothetical protein
VSEFSWERKNATIMRLWLGVKQNKEEKKKKRLKCTWVASCVERIGEKNARSLQKGGGLDVKLSEFFGVKNLVFFLSPFG